MDDRLTEELVRRGALRPEQLEKLQGHHERVGGDIDVAILELGLMPERELAEAMAAVSGVSCARAQDASLPQDPAATRAFPEQWAKKHLLAPLHLIDGELTVLSRCPPNLALINKLTELLDVRVKPLVAPTIRLYQRLALLYGIEIPPRVRRLLERSGGVGNESLRPPSTRPDRLSLLPSDPMTFAEAVASLKRADTRDEIVDLVLKQACRELEFAALFAIHADRIVGWNAAGNGADKIKHVQIPAGEHSPFWMSVETHAHFLGPPMESEQKAFSVLGRGVPRAYLLIPLRVRSRPIALLYAENGPRAISPRTVASLMVFATHAQQALEGLLVRMKYESRDLVLKRNSSLPVPELVQAPHLDPSVATLSAASEAKFSDPASNPQRTASLPAPSHSWPTRQGVSDLPAGLDLKSIPPDAMLDEEDTGEAGEAGVEPSSDNDSLVTVHRASQIARHLDSAPADPGVLAPSIPASRARFGEPPSSEAATPVEEHPGLSEAFSGGDWAEEESESESAGARDNPFDERTLIIAEAVDGAGGDIYSALDAGDLDEQPTADLLPESAHLFAQDARSEPPASAQERPELGRALDRAMEIDDPSTRPDLSAEAWVRASSEISRPRTRSSPRPQSVDPEPAPKKEPVIGRPAPSGLNIPDSADTLPDAVPGLSSIRRAPTASAIRVNRERTDDEIDALLVKLESDDEALRVNARQILESVGPRIVPRVLARFPGRSYADPFTTNGRLPAFSGCGALHSLLFLFRREAAEGLLPHLDSSSPLLRFYAVYFYAAIITPRALPRIIRRLHDEEPRIAMQAVRTLYKYRQVKEFSLVRQHLLERFRSASPAAREHAARLLTLFRDTSAVPVLLEVFEQRERRFYGLVEEALAEITKQNFGPNLRKWRRWWESHRDVSRVQWLIEGLDSADPDLRESAAAELKAMTGKDLGFDARAPKRERSEARDRWRSWWDAKAVTHSLDRRA